MPCLESFFIASPLLHHIGKSNFKVRLKKHFFPLTLPIIFSINTPQPEPEPKTEPVSLTLTLIPNANPPDTETSCGKFEVKVNRTQNERWKSEGPSESERILNLERKRAKEQQELITDVTCEDCFSLFSMGMDEWKQIQHPYLGYFVLLLLSNTLAIF